MSGNYEKMCDFAAVTVTYLHSQVCSDPWNREMDCKHIEDYFKRGCTRNTHLLLRASGEARKHKPEKR